MDVNKLLQERAALVMNIAQMDIMLKDPILSDFMMAGIARPSSIVNAAGQQSAEVKELSIVEARAYLQEKLEENANEIKALVRKVQI